MNDDALVYYVLSYVFIKLLKYKRFVKEVVVKNKDFVRVNLAKIHAASERVLLIVTFGHRFVNKYLVYRKIT